MTYKSLKRWSWSMVAVSMGLQLMWLLFDVWASSVVMGAGTLLQLFLMRRVNQREAQRTMCEFWLLECHRLRALIGERQNKHDLDAVDRLTGQYVVAVSRAEKEVNILDRI